jgi:hypothetical protein
MVLKKKNMGIIKLGGIHNDFLTRDILDYELIFELGSKKTIISSGKIRTNNLIYTDFKFSNEIREKGGDTFIFPLKELNKFNSEPMFIRLFDRNTKDFLFETMFNPYVLSENKSELSFNIDDEIQRFSFNYDRIEREYFRLELRNLKISSRDLEERNKFRVFMWLSSSLGKQNLIDFKKQVNVLISRLRTSYIMNGEDLCINGEIFNEENKSILQFRKKIFPDKKDFRNEKYESENYSLHLDYSIII